MKRRNKKVTVIFWLFVFMMITGYAVILSSLSNVRNVRKIIRQARYLSSDYYVTNGSLQNWRPAVQSADQYDVLLNSYMNSGSTFTGRLLGFHKDSFYFYEPLWHITLWSYYRSNTTMCSTRTTSCRYISRAEMNRNMPIKGRRLDLSIIHDINTEIAVPLEVPQKILDHVYSCNLSRLANLVQPGVTANAIFSGHSWESFRHCDYMKRPIGICLSELETVCRRAKHRVSKVLRLTLGGLEPVLKHNPKLKVVHLFRDPRAIINSRIETKGYPLRSNPLGRNDIQNNAKALCDKMNTDIEEGEKLKSKFPDRFRFMHYEDVAMNRNSIKKLYDYVGMIYEMDSFNHIYKVKTNNPERKLERKEKARKTNNALWWRTYLSYDIIKQVNIVCYAVIAKLGYPQFNNVTDLRNINKTDGLSKLKYRL